MAHRFYEDRVDEHAGEVYVYDPDTGIGIHVSQWANELCQVSDGEYRVMGIGPGKALEIAHEWAGGNRPARVFPVPESA